MRPSRPQCRITRKCSCPARTFPKEPFVCAPAQIALRSGSARWRASRRQLICTPLRGLASTRDHPEQLLLNWFTELGELPCRDGFAASLRAPHPTATPVGREWRRAALRGWFSTGGGADPAGANEAFRVGAARLKLSRTGSPLNERLLLAGMNVLMEIAFVRLPAHVLRTNTRVASRPVARSRSAER